MWGKGVGIRKALGMCGDIVVSVGERIVEFCGRGIPGKRI